MLRRAGLSSATIAQPLPCIVDADGRPSERATPKLVGRLTAECARIDGLIADLARSRHILDEVIDMASDL